MSCSFRGASLRRCYENKNQGELYILAVFIGSAAVTNIKAAVPAGHIHRLSMRRCIDSSGYGPIPPGIALLL